MWKTAFSSTSDYFEHSIIRYGLTCTPSVLQCLNKDVLICLAWNQAAYEAFDNLKTAFTTAPILKHPDLSKPIMLEVNASKSGAGAVLSQSFRDKPKLHPVPFFSKKLSPAEQNIGTHEMLVLKLSLEQWHRWQEGALYPFTIFIDHKNLDYLKIAKCLNPHEAQEPFISPGLIFMLCYWPSSKHTKADFLSHICPTETKTESLKPYCLPPASLMP